MKAIKEKMNKYKIDIKYEIIVSPINTTNAEQKHNFTS